MIVAAAATGAAQPADEPRLFRIGFLERETTGHPSEESLDRLRDSLEQDREIAEELGRRNYRGIGLYPADGPADMVRRLNAREFDVAFVPANLYDEQTAGYSVILRARREDDINWTTSAGPSALRRGVVFVSPRRPEIFEEETLSPQRAAELLGRERFAVVSTQSVAGFHAPLLAVHKTYGEEALSSGYIYFENSEEVVKGVLAGLANVGACELPALDRVLQAEGLEDQRNRLVRVVLTTDPVITDPVVVRPGLSPQHSSLGRKLRLRIRALSLEENYEGIQYLEATDADYRLLSELLSDFRNRFTEQES